jgi:type I restriction enzyme M protein
MAAYEWLLEETKGALGARTSNASVSRHTLVRNLWTPSALGTNESVSPWAATENLPWGYHLRTGSWRTLRRNPDQSPFGTKGANQAPEREDFTVETSNKQLNFVQHVLTTSSLVAVPLSCCQITACSRDKAGEVFEILMQDCNVHSILRLPRGTFTPYSQGVKANVVFFQKGLPDRECLDIRWSRKRAGRDQEVSASYGLTLRRVRDVLWG